VEKGRREENGIAGGIRERKKRIRENRTIRTTKENKETISLIMVQYSVHKCSKIMSLINILMKFSLMPNDWYSRRECSYMQLLWESTPIFQVQHFAIYELFKEFVTLNTYVCLA
jgi:hypothetical protein